MKAFIALTLLMGFSSREAFPISGDEENKVQERALILAIDTGKDSPEIDTLLYQNDLQVEDVEALDEEEGDDN